MLVLQENNRDMKKVYLIAAVALLSLSLQAQEEENESDTTRVNLGKTELIIVQHDNDIQDILNLDDQDGEKKHSKKDREAHWAGVDFGFTMLMNPSFENDFPNHPYWKNDASKSTVWNLNLLEHKFNIAKEYFGVTTGLGFSFTSVAFSDNYVLSHSADTLIASIDTVTNYSTNKLKATYLTVPLLLEFNTNADSDKSFYLAAGVVGGVRLTSKVKRKGEVDGDKFTFKESSIYGLNPFKLDAAVRLGYSDFGVFANYSLLPLFDTGKTVEAYPLTFGLSMNF